MLIAFHLDYYFRYQPRAKVGLYSASHTTVILPGQLIIESPASQNLMVPFCSHCNSAHASAARETRRMGLSRRSTFPLWRIFAKHW
jgi:hypothetical protein